MRRSAAALLAVLALATCACGESSSPESKTPGAKQAFQPRFDPQNFRGAVIDNSWYPLKPRTKFSYRGTKDQKPAREVVTVTRKTKTILGVRCTVVHDVLLLAGEPAEETFDWYAQDIAGNVWYFGEATKELENGKVTSTEGSWQAGAKGARPGIIMQAKPKVGDRYAQEHYEGQAEDHAQVVSLSANVAVPRGFYSGVQLTKEWTPLEPGVLDHKYYARGVGLVKEESVKGPRERVELVDVTTS